MREKKSSNDYVIRVLDQPGEIDAENWNSLLAAQPAASPFMRHEYLLALHDSNSATPASGWTPQFIAVERGQRLVAACALYLKDHSYGSFFIPEFPELPCLIHLPRKRDNPGTLMSR